MISKVCGVDLMKIYLLYIDIMFNTWLIHAETNCTCNGWSEWRVCLSAARSHSAGAASPVSDSFIPKRKEQNWSYND